LLLSTQLEAENILQFSTVGIVADYILSKKEKSRTFLNNLEKWWENGIRDTAADIKIHA